MSVSRQRLGKLGEEAAAKYLQEHGYLIIERNWRCRSGEIDIIARKQEQIVFVEVRTRASKSFGTPQESVTPRKQRQVRQTASIYLYQHRIADAPLRFDLISIQLMDDGTWDIQHLPAAF